MTDLATAVFGWGGIMTGDFLRWSWNGQGKKLGTETGASKIHRFKDLIVGRGGFGPASLAVEQVLEQGPFSPELIARAVERAMDAVPQACRENPQIQRLLEAGCLHVLGPISPDGGPPFLGIARIFHKTGEVELRMRRAALFSGPFGSDPEGVADLVGAWATGLKHVPDWEDASACVPKSLLRGVRASARLVGGLADRFGKGPEPSCDDMTDVALLWVGRARLSLWRRAKARLFFARLAPTPAAVVERLTDRQLLDLLAVEGE